MPKLTPFHPQTLMKPTRLTTSQAKNVGSSSSYLVASTTWIPGCSQH